MPDDLSLAIDVSNQAAALLLELRRTAAAEGWEPKRTKDTGDQASHELLMAAIGAARPGDAILSEEGADDLRRLDADRVWIVDPLDGTREFSELERDDWAVHVALVEHGELVLGVVNLPSLGLVLTGHDLHPVFPAGPPKILVSRTRPPAEAEKVAAALGAELVPMGSAGAKAGAVIRGQAHLYLHSGGQYEWDLAAPVGAARAAGLHTSRIDGSPFKFNQRDVLLPDALIGDPVLAAAALEVLCG